MGVEQRTGYIGVALARQEVEGLPTLPLFRREVGASIVFIDANSPNLEDVIIATVSNVQFSGYDLVLEHGNNGNKQVYSFSSGEYYVIEDTGITFRGKFKRGKLNLFVTRVPNILMLRPEFIGDIVQRNDYGPLHLERYNPERVAI